MEYYDWDRNKSKKAFVTLKRWPEAITDEDVKNYSIDGDEDAQRYKKAVTKLFEEGKLEFSIFEIYRMTFKNIDDDVLHFVVGENIENLFEYKEAVKKIVF